MPASLIAAAVLLTLFVPGYLFQAGVREFTNVLAAERDVYAVAQAVAISAGFLLAIFVVWKLVSPGTLEDSLLHDPASGNDKGLTWPQVIALVLLLMFSNLAGKGFGRLMSRRRKTRLDASTTPTGVARAFHTVLDPFFSTSPLDACIDQVISAAKTDDTYVRLVRQGKVDVIGLVDAEAAKASSSALGSGIALSLQWTYAADIGWRPSAGAHVAKPGLIEIFWWNSARPGPPPPWLMAIKSHVAGSSPSGDPT